MFPLEVFQNFCFPSKQFIHRITFKKNEVLRYDFRAWIKADGKLLKVAIFIILKLYTCNQRQVCKLVQRSSFPAEALHPSVRPKTNNWEKKRFRK